MRREVGVVRQIVLVEVEDILFRFEAKLVVQNDSFIAH